VIADIAVIGEQRLLGVRRIPRATSVISDTREGIDLPMTAMSAMTRDHGDFF